MKIKFDDAETCFLSDIDFGECFMFDSKYYMRVKAITPEQTSSAVVDLKTGTLVYIDIDEEVIAIDAIVVIGDI